ncbi:MAG: PAS domain S-box protein [Bryobacterales bacterium]
MDHLAQIFSTDLMPHGYCIQWRPALLWLHVISDALIAVSYFAIPIGLHAVARRHGDLPFTRLVRLAAAFILACGTSHLLAIWTMWRPDYGVEALVKAATAIISLVAAAAFVRTAPQILGLANIRELQSAIAANTQELTRANEALREEITQRDQAEKALIEREARLRSIVDTAVNAILTIDEAGVVESMNAAAVGLFGYSESRVIGRNVSMLMPPPDRDMHDEYLRRYRETGEQRIIGVGREVVGRRFDGSLIPLELAVSEFDSADGRRFTGILSDLSSRKDFEKRLADSLEELDAANRALEERNGELDDFAHTVSHDLKEPLRGIQTYCWTLVEDMGEPLGEEARSRLSRIQGLAKRMDAMIDSVLKYSRSSRQSHRQRVNLNDAVQEALDMLAMTLRERGCDVQIPRPFPEAECDPVAVVESLKNLISNASKYNDKTDKRIEIGWEQPEDKPLTVYVRDNGIGIEEADHNGVFRIFHRAQRGAEFGEGAGAGLAIVKKLIENQGGQVWVESTPGKGSTFRFTLGPKRP